MSLGAEHLAGMRRAAVRQEAFGKAWLDAKHSCRAPPQCHNDRGDGMASSRSGAPASPRPRRRPERSPLPNPIAEWRDARRSGRASKRPANGPRNSDRATRTRPRR
jgi:hypothetical protein